MVITAGKIVRKKKRCSRSKKNISAMDTTQSRKLTRPCCTQSQNSALQVKELITFGCRTVTAQIQKGSLTTLLQLRSMMRNKACAKVRASYKVKAAASVSVSSCNRISRGLARVLRWSRKSVSATCLPTQHRFSSASMASFREVY